MPYNTPLPPSPPTSPSPKSHYSHLLNEAEGTLDVPHSGVILLEADLAPLDPLTRSPFTSSSLGTSTGSGGELEEYGGMSTDLSGSSIGQGETGTGEGIMGSSGKRGRSKLDQFQLIRVLGKGCAGRVSCPDRTSSLLLRKLPMED
jgi:hypothetical protein